MRRWLLSLRGEEDRKTTVGEAQSEGEEGAAAFCFAEGSGQAAR